MPIRSKWESLPTEAINPSTLALDKLSAADIVELMCAEDRKVVAAVQREKDRIALGAEMIAVSLQRGGRIVFVGAGTSGRIVTDFPLLSRLSISAFPFLVLFISERSATTAEA